MYMSSVTDFHIAPHTKSNVHDTGEGEVLSFCSLYLSFLSRRLPWPSGRVCGVDYDTDSGNIWGPCGCTRAHVEKNTRRASRVPSGTGTRCQPSGTNAICVEKALEGGKHA